MLSSVARHAVAQRSVTWRSATQCPVAGPAAIVPLEQVVPATAAAARRPPLQPSPLSPPQEHRRVRTRSLSRSPSHLCRRRLCWHVYQAPLPVRLPHIPSLQQRHSAPHGRCRHPQRTAPEAHALLDWTSPGSQRHGWLVALPCAVWVVVPGLLSWVLAHRACRGRGRSPAAHAGGRQ